MMRFAVILSEAKDLLGARLVPQVQPRLPVEQALRRSAPQDDG
jgi:hypothetical protein